MRNGPSILRLNDGILSKYSIKVGSLEIINDFYLQRRTGEFSIFTLQNWNKLTVGHL